MIVTCPTVYMFPRRDCNVDRWPNVKMRNVTMVVDPFIKTLSSRSSTHLWHWSVCVHVWKPLQVVLCSHCRSMFKSMQHRCSSDQFYMFFGETSSTTILSVLPIYRNKGVYGVAWLTGILFISINTSNNYATVITTKYMYQEISKETICFWYKYCI